jgi:hypothetical protein
VSDTDTVRVRSERRTRKVPAIVLERPALRPGRMLLGFLAGTGAGLVLGVLSYLMLQAGPDHAELPGRATGFLPPYVGSYLVVGLIVGLAWAFLEGRTVTPRRDVVEVEVSAGRFRRRSTSTAIERRRR